MEIGKGFEAPSAGEDLSGRDFMEATKGMKTYDREKEMMEGDFIKMSAELFKRWVGDVISGDEASLDGLGDIKIMLVEKRYTEDRFKNKSEKILVEGAGVQKEVFASLFFNYNRPPINTGEICLANKYGNTSGFSQEADNATPGNVG